MVAKLLRLRLKHLVKVIEQCIQNKFDCIIFIEGKRGLGKSTLAYKICCKMKNIPMKFKPERDIVFSREETIKQLANKKGGIIFSDEMVNVAYNRDFYQEEQKTLLKALNMYRDSCNVFIGCIPRFIDLDTQIQRLCKLRITIVRRGVALIQTQLSSIYTKDAWDVRNNMKIESKWSLRSKNPKYAQLTTADALMPFGDIRPTARAKYERIKQEKRGHVFSQYKEIKKNTIYENFLDLVKTKQVNEEIIKAFAKTNNVKPKTVKDNLNSLLAEEGTKRLNDYLKKPEPEIIKPKGVATNLGFTK